jgi:hypothetical protein
LIVDLHLHSSACSNDARVSTVSCFDSRNSARLPPPKPVFKNPKVAALYDRWQRVKQLAAERQSRLKNMLDRLNEVEIQLLTSVSTVSHHIQLLTAWHCY